MKITSFTAYKVESKKEKANLAYYPPYIRLEDKVWINSNSEIICSTSFARELEEEFQSVNGVMHEQLELFHE